jgi:hypothetical protein
VGPGVGVGVTVGVGVAVGVGGWGVGVGVGAAHAAANASTTRAAGMSKLQRRLFIRSEDLRDDCERELGSSVQVGSMQYLRMRGAPWVHSSEESVLKGEQILNYS